MYRKRNVSMRRRKNRRRKQLRLLLIGLAAAVFVYCSARIIIYLLDSGKNAEANRQLAGMYERSQTTAEETKMISAARGESAGDTVFEAESAETDMQTQAEPAGGSLNGYQRIGNEISPLSRELYAVNPDLVAWLKIPGVLSLPVVYRDNSYYLTHDFYGRESEFGTLFLDVLHPLKEETQYLFIHGHAMYDGSMFGMLTHYRNKDYTRKHPTLTLNTLYSSDTYEVIGVLYADEADMAPVAGLGRPEFATEERFDAFIDNLREHAIRFTDDEIPPDTALLALSTCYQEGRIVVVFKRTSSQPI